MTLYNSIIYIYIINEVLRAFGSYIRDVVNDAYKLEALRRIGLVRCIEYTKHAHKKNLEKKYQMNYYNKRLKIMEMKN